MFPPHISIPASIGMRSASFQIPYFISKRGVDIGLMGTIVKNEIGDQSSNPNEDFFYDTLC